VITDVTAPTSAITAPAAGANLALNSAVTITGTATDAGSGVVGGVEVSVDGGTTWRRATGRASWSFSWTPTVAGSYTIRSRAADDSGNLESPAAGRTVTVGTDTTPPTISGRSPAASATNVALGSSVTVTFNEAMAAGSITSSTFTLRDAAANAVAGTVSYNATTRVATFDPTGNLALSGGSVYTATMSGGAGGVTDVAGNALAANSAWSFTTTLPVVSTLVPASGATGASRTANITASFNGPMSGASIGTTTFELRVGGATGALVPAVVNTTTLSTGATRANLNPNATLAASTAYTAIVRGGAAGVKTPTGVALAADRVWSFTTGP
jgi:hypothetical protein